MNKVCIYAISKNEEQFVDRWVQSMSEADEIIVVDTGSTDRTVEKLQSYGVRVIEEKFYPWRFDTPRNYALRLVSPDCNICMSTDLDEVLEPGWANTLREKWIDGIHKRATYKYAWSHNEDGSVGRVFRYDKIHSKDWEWQYPVHELLARNGDCTYRENETLDLFDDIFLHHYPDKTKSRASYLPLLIQRAEQYPDDSYGKLYLAHEYFYHADYQSCINTINTLILPNKKAYNSMEVANIHLFKGNSYYNMKQYDLAASEYLLGIFADSQYRENYLQLANTYNMLGQYDSALGIMRDCEKRTRRRYVWLEQDTSWTSEPYDILSISYFYLGDIAKSLEMVCRALNYDATNERILENKILIENKLKE